MLAAALATVVLAASSPALAPVSLDPLRVRGTGFEPAERVRVLVETSAGTTSRRARAGRTGRFVLTFRGVRACDGVAVSARGSRGSRAAFQFSALAC